MNICILASIGCQNLGDELILKNEIRIIEDMYKNKSKNKIFFRVFTYDKNDIFYKKKNIKYLEYFPIGIRKIKNIIRNTKNFFNFFKTIFGSDLIVIGGGGLFFDSELQKNKNPLNLWLLRVYFIKLFKKKLIFYGVGIDVKNKKNLEKIKKIFSGAKKIYVRDKNSQKILNKLNIKSNIVLDPVFFDSKEQKVEKILKKSYILENLESNNFDIEKIKKVSFKNKRVGIALRKGYINNGKLTEEKLVFSLIDFIVNTGGKVILLPHSFHKTDNIANDYKFLKQSKNGNIRITKNIKETYKIYKNKEIDICIAGRLHSIILSQTYKINFIAIDYSKKTQELIKLVNK